jgi:hypothetical protein
MTEYYFENNITLCFILSHTFHKLQPCDVGVFGSLKAAYHKQVDIYIEEMHTQSASSISYFFIAVHRNRHLPLEILGLAGQMQVCICSAQIEYLEARRTTI